MRNRRGINLRQAQAIQRRLLAERQARMQEYFRRQAAGEDTSDLNIDNDFDMSDNMAEGEIQEWEGGQE